MTDTRAAYRRGRDREDQSLPIVRHMLTSFGINATLITGKEDNFRFGDLANNGDMSNTTEAKSQPMAPYTQNWVEVGQYSDNPERAGGMSLVADTLDMTVPELAAVTVTDYRVGQRPHPRAPLGTPKRIAASLVSICAARTTIYVDIEARMLFLYKRDEIVSAVRKQVRSRGLALGPGNANPDTLGVWIPQPRWILKNVGGLWTAHARTPGIDRNDPLDVRRRGWQPLPEPDNSTCLNAIAAHLRGAPLTTAAPPLPAHAAQLPLFAEAV